MSTYGWDVIGVVVAVTVYVVTGGGGGMGGVHATGDAIVREY